MDEYEKPEEQEAAYRRRHTALCMTLDLVAAGKVVVNSYDITHMAGELAKFLEGGK